MSNTSPPYYRSENEGTYRNEDRDVKPGSSTPPVPGQESVGPAMYDLISKTNRALEAQAVLLKAAMGDKKSVVENSTGETDANGNLDIVLFRVPQGYQFIATRVTVEAAGFSPAVPYSNAAAWIALIRGTQFAVGSILDFGPPVSGGEMLPCIFSSSDSHAPMLRGGEILGLHIAGSASLATTGIWARTQGRLVAL